MKLITANKSNRWLVLDQSFFAMFITFSLIELANVGAGLIDGLIVSNFLSAPFRSAESLIRTAQKDRSAALQLNERFPYTITPAVLFPAGAFFCRKGLAKYP